jgi:hypothetical protein
MKPDKTHRLKIPIDGCPNCPACEMRMIVAGGFGLDPEHKTFECLRCGHIEKPETTAGNPGRNPAG